MAMVHVPWTRRRWALPFLTILVPSERYNTAHRRRHKKLTDFARQAIRQVRRWLPKRKIVVVADSSFAALDLIAIIRRHVCLVTRLRLDASLFEPAPERRPGQNGRPPKKGRRLPKLSELREEEKMHGSGWQSSRHAKMPRRGRTALRSLLDEARSLASAQ